MDETSDKNKEKDDESGDHDVISNCENSPCTGGSQEAAIEDMNAAQQQIETIELSSDWEIFVKDAQALLESKELQKLTRSTSRLLTSSVGTAIHMAFLPVHITTSTMGTAIQCVHSHSRNLLLLIHDNNNSDSSDSDDDTTCNSTETSDSTSQQQFHIYHIPFMVAPLLLNTASRIAGDIGSSVIHLLGWQTSGQSSSEKRSSTSHNKQQPHHSNGTYPHHDLDSIDLSSSSHQKQYDLSKIPSSSSLSPLPSSPASHHFQHSSSSSSLSSNSSFMIRVCDLQIHGYSATYSSNNTSKLFFVPIGIEQPAQPELSVRVIDAMVSMATSFDSFHPNHHYLILTNNTHNTTNAVSHRWKEEGSTSKLIKYSSNPQKFISKLESEVLLWSGKFVHDTNKSQHSNFHYSKNIPLFKARGIISHMTPRQVLEMFLDSSQVSKYNKYSKGRKDLVILQKGVDTINGLYGDGETKIVESVTNVPLSGNVMTMQTLLHARYLPSSTKTDGYIIVSRSVSTHNDEWNDDNKENINVKNNNEQESNLGSRNEIHWGIHIIRSIPGHPNKTDLTNISQVNSNLLPGFLAQKVGLMCCCDFFKKLRSI